MDFPKEFNLLAQQEFIDKYINTYFEVNNTFVDKIKSISKDFIEFESAIIPLSTLKTIKPILPKIGLYEINNNLIYLYKIPTRQYNKGCILHKTHDYYPLEVSTIPFTLKDLLTRGTYIGECCIFNRNVYIRWNKVGSLIDNEITVLRPKFTPEIKELWKHLKINTNIPNQKQLNSKQKTNLNPMKMNIEVNF